MEVCAEQKNEYFYRGLGVNSLLVYGCKAEWKESRRRLVVVLKMILGVLRCASGKYYEHTYNIGP